MSTDTDQSDAIGLFDFQPTIDADDAFATWLESAGIHPEFAVRSRYSTLIGVVYPAQWTNGVRRWRGATIDAYRWPIMWAPLAIAARVQIDDPDVGVRCEDDDEWIVRMALEMSVRGLCRDGEQLDMLAAAGINLSSITDRDRVQRWVDGTPDSTLDQLEWPALPESIADPDPEWAVVAARAFLDQAEEWADVLEAEDMLLWLTAEDANGIEKMTLAGMCLKAASVFEADAAVWVALATKVFDVTSPDVLGAYVREFADMLRDVIGSDEDE